jgi:hypothetical protein
MCASKFHDDTYYSNAFFAKIGGVSNREMNRLEIEFLDLITFELFVPAQQFEDFFAEISSPTLHTHCSCEIRQAADLQAEHIHQAELIGLSPSPALSEISQFSTEDSHPISDDSDGDEVLVDPEAHTVNVHDGLAMATQELIAVA